MALLKLPYFSLPPIPSTPIKENLSLSSTVPNNPPGFGRKTLTITGVRPQNTFLARRSCTRVNGKFIRTEDSDDEEDEEDDKNKEKPKNDPFLMDEDERLEWRRSIREVMKNYSDGHAAAGEEEEEETETAAAPEEEEVVVDPAERSEKVKNFLSEYPLVVEEEDPDWPEDADGWGFNFDQFFDKITIKNNPKKDDDEDDDDDDEKYESDKEVVWQDDNYIRPIKDIVSADWDEAVFKDISPLIVLVHNRYKRPKVNEKFRDQLEKAVNIIWNCRLPSPRCVAIDAIVDTDLVSALRVSVFPELIFTKAGKILYREKANRSADDLSKMMAFFYYGSQKPPCLKGIGVSQELIPPAPAKAKV